MNESFIVTIVYLDSFYLTFFFSDDYNVVCIVS